MLGLSDYQDPVLVLLESRLDVIAEFSLRQTQVVLNRYSALVYIIHCVFLI